MCIVHVSDDLDQNFERIRKSHAAQKYKWFYGEDDWPSKMFEPQSIWIINPRSQKALQVKSMKELDLTLTDLNDSQLKWIDISQYNEL